MGTQAVESNGDSGASTRADAHGMGTKKSLWDVSLECCRNQTSTQGGKMGEVRQFASGATRDSDEDKHDPEGFLSPLVVSRFNEYMHKHRKQSDGGLRASDNWQKGIPREQYIKSLWRHFLDLWLAHRGHRASQDEEESLCAILFNTQGYLFELLKSRELPRQTMINQARSLGLLKEDETISSPKLQLYLGDREYKGGSER